MALVSAEIAGDVPRLAKHSTISVVAHWKAFQNVSLPLFTKEPVVSQPDNECNPDNADAFKGPTVSSGRWGYLTIARIITSESGEYICKVFIPF